MSRVRTMSGFWNEEGDGGAHATANLICDKASIRLQKSMHGVLAQR